jgi:hypothetical protein
MQPDTELETWRRQWQAQEVPADLRRRVEHEIRDARRGTFIAIAVTVLFGVWMPVRAAISGRPEDVVLAAGVWAFIALAWIVSMRITRGASRPSAATAAAFLDFSILSCRRRLAGLSAGAVLYVVLLTFIIALNYFEASRETPVEISAYLVRPRNLVVWGVTLIIGALAWWRRQTVLRELQNLRALQKSQYSATVSSTKQ